VGPRVGLDGRKISSPRGFDPGPSSPQSVAIPTEVPGPQMGASKYIYINMKIEEINELFESNFVRKR